MTQKHTIKELEKLLKSRDPLKIEDRENFVHAAVMMILEESPQGLSMLFIKRPESDGDAFSGHMAFPGGKVMVGDESKLAAAIRETREEVGVDLDACGRILGELDDVNPNNPRANNFIVTPYLSVLSKNVPIVPNLLEVEAALWIPVNHLLDGRNFAVRMKERNGKIVEDYVYSFDKYIIWGMTGRILRGFFSISSHLF